MYSQKFREAVERVLENEGGLVDDPSDPGGLTNFGISAAAYPAVDIRNLTREGAIEIYWRDYWGRCEEIDFAPLARQVFDMSVNAGVIAAVKLLQEACNMLAWPALLVDGKMGAATLKRVGNLPGEAVLAAYKYKRVSYYLGVADRRPSSRKYMVGWLRRVERA